MSADRVETVKSLRDVYASPTAVDFQTTRYRALIEKFRARFDADPQFIARSPGRVNIIGEHIDYSNYSVLPMALSDKDILIACRTEPLGTGRVRVANVSEKFPERAIQLSSTMPYLDIDAKVHEWSNYFKSGLKGVLSHLQPSELLSTDCLVDGSIPAGAGVSSSSAFVCCSALTTLRAYGGDMSRKELAETAIISERFVGVESGGMDQCASIFGKLGSVILIDFYPSLQVNHSVLPNVPTHKSVCFVIAHTMVTSDKHVTAPVCYNLRVVETRMAALIMARKLFMENSQVAWHTLIKLRDVHEYCLSTGMIDSNVKDSEEAKIRELDFMLDLADRLLDSKDAGYTLEEMATILNLSVTEMQDRFMSSYPIRAEKFHLYKRAKHVFSEAKRVYEFQQVCHENGSDAYARLGHLMDASQESCRDLFECSCPELDLLCDIARKNGALGSRLTGAGWGGCTVSMVESENLASFMKALEVEYYYSRLGSAKITDVLFASPPGRGSVVIDVNDV